MAVMEKEAPPAKGSVSVGHLQHALSVVSGALDRRATIPVLACVRIEQLPEGIAAETTNLDLAIRVLLPESSGPQKAILTPAEKFMAWAKLLSGESVSISATDARATVRCGDARAVLPLMSAAQWPQTIFKGDGKALRADKTSLARALRFAMLAVSQEESRYTLNAVLFQTEGSMLRLVATDGHRMMVYSIPCDDQINEIAPRAMIKALIPLLGDGGEVDFAFGSDAIVATIPGETPVFVSSRRVTGSFPNWQAVVPTDERTPISVQAKDLLICLERCMLLAPEESNAVALTFGDGKIKIEAKDAQAGEADEILPCKGAPKEPIRIGFCGSYLTDLLKKLDGEVRIDLPSTNGSALRFHAEPVDGETLDYIVMPLRIG